ncbi:MAG: hypothetical protein ACYC9Y_07345 [Candidatus Methylomirabilia bacterium]
MKRCRYFFAILLLIPALGCATFSYVRTSGQSPPGEPRFNLRIGVVRFSQPSAAGFYPIRFSNTLGDPIGDLSRAVADELRGSGLFAEVIYLDGPPPGRTDLEYYREVYRLAAILSGDVTSFYVTSVPELWSLVPPFIALWPLHVLGLPTAPCHDSVVLHGTLSLQGLEAGAGGWRSSEQKYSWHEHNWYSSLSIPAIERAVQTRAMDHFVTSLVAALRRELSPASMVW